MPKTLLEHLTELRERLKIIIIIFLIIATITFLLSNTIIDFIVRDLIPSSASVIATNPLEYIYAKINASIFIGILLTMPLLIYHVLKFIGPGLYENEKNAIKKTVITSTGLFISGLLFGYFVLVRFCILFFASLTKEANILNLWSITQFLNFVFWTVILIGLAFQLPLILLTLLKIGIINKQWLTDNRKYFIIAIFIVAATITPQDPITLLLVAIPMIVLYQITLFLAKTVIKDTELKG